MKNSQSGHKYGWLLLFFCLCIIPLMLYSTSCTQKPTEEEIAKRKILGKWKEDEDREPQILDFIAGGDVIWSNRQRVWSVLNDGRIKVTQYSSDFMSSSVWIFEFKSENVIETLDDDKSRRFLRFK